MGADPGPIALFARSTFRHLACSIHIRGRRHRDSQVPSFVSAAGDPEYMAATPASNRRPTAASAASIWSSREPWFRSSPRSTAVGAT